MSEMARRGLLASVLSLFLAGAVTQSRISYPATKTVAATNAYFGTTVADPYRWLENAGDPEVAAWAAAQTKLALRFLVATPDFGPMQARIVELERGSTTRSSVRVRGTRLFYERDTPPQEHAQLVVRDGLDGAERVLFDPAAYAIAGAQPAIEDYTPSDDGTKVEIETDLGGFEDETIRVVDVATGASIGDPLAHVGGAGSPVACAWDADGNGFDHTLWPKNADGTYARSGMLVYHHVLGTDAATDTYVFGRDRPAKAEYVLGASLDGSARSIQLSDGDGVASTIFLQAGNGPFELAALPEAGIGESGKRGGAFVGATYFAIAHGRDPRGEIISLEPRGSFARVRLVVPATEVAPQEIVPIPSGFITVDSDGGDGSARLFDTHGTQRATLPIPRVSSIGELAADPRGGTIVLGYENDTTRPKLFAYDPASNAVRDTGIADAGPGDYANVVTERVLVPSLDGTAKIPLEITHANGIPADGSAPTILTAYGAYGRIMPPQFSPASLAWYERGGVFARAFVRGGGEYGESWHRAARLQTKTISSDDLAACAKWLGQNGFGNAQHLGITGSGAGGFLMGLALSRNPELYRAVFAHAGFYDLLRYELTPGGAYGTSEFGSITESSQLASMLHESPYHNLHRGAAYPAVLMTTGESDSHVDPYMSRKMIATLQAASSSVNPILLIQKAGQGHGSGRSFDDRVEAATIEYTFFDSQLR